MWRDVAFVADYTRSSPGVAVASTANQEMAEQAIVVEVDLRRLGETFADARVIRLETEDNVARIEDGEPQVDGRPRNP